MHGTPETLLTRRDYLRLWNVQHPGYKTADSRRRALFRPAKRAFYREILSVRVRVNLFPLAIVERGKKG